MPDQKISADPVLANPSAQARLAGIDVGTDPTKNYQFAPAGVKSWLKIAAADIIDGSSAFVTGASLAALQDAVTALTNRVAALESGGTSPNPLAVNFVDGSSVNFIDGSAVTFLN